MMGQVQRVAKALERMSEIEGVAAVPPSEAVAISIEDAPTTLRNFSGSAADDARSFEKAGWRFVSTSHKTAVRDQRKLFRSSDRRLMIGGRRLTVKFQPDVDGKTISEILARHGLSIKRKLRFGGSLFSVGDAESGDIVQAAKRLAEHDQVVYAEPEMIEPLSGRGSR